MGKYSPETLADLKKSGLFESDADLMKIEELDEKKLSDMTLGQFRGTGYLIPYFDFQGRRIDFFRVRFHQSLRNLKYKSKSTKKQRYWQPAGVGIEVYLPPSMPWRKALKDKEMIGYITEGEKKAAKACKEGLLTIGLGGVDSFASSEAGVELHPTVRDFVNGRSIGIVYDSDIRTKPEVMRAARDWRNGRCKPRRMKLFTSTCPQALTWTTTYGHIPSMTSRHFQRGRMTLRPELRRSETSQRLASARSGKVSVI